MPLEILDCFQRNSPPTPQDPGKEVCFIEQRSKTSTRPSLVYDSLKLLCYKSWESGVSNSRI